MQAELQMAEQLAREASQLLLDHVRRGFAVEEKTPDDPVTVADREASALIVAGLRAAFPQDGILSEELADTAERLSRRRVWIIDPIDGTREFVKGTGDYVVSIGLAVQGEPVLGVLAAPARGDVYMGVVGEGVWKNGDPVSFSGRDASEALIAVSDTEFERELSQFPLERLAPSGSIAYKLGRIAAGEADATFTINPRSEWDIAAGHALVRAAGGELTTRGGGAIRYNQREPRLRRGIIGGRQDVVACLAGTLKHLGVPEQQLYLRDSDDLWQLLSGEDRSALRGYPDLHVRHAAGQIEALVMLERREGWHVSRSEGRTQALRILLNDLQREYGPLDLH